MPLTRLTITGADDSTDPLALRDLAKDFPFVEWGILIGSTPGVPRFPSEHWLGSLQYAARSDYQVQFNLSLHLCGKWLREIASGSTRPLVEFFGEGLLRMFQRVQLNWHGEPQESGTADAVVQSFLRLRDEIRWTPQIIFQLDGENNHLRIASIAAGLSCAGLHDVSHGAGLLPDQWPAPLPTVETGWAGGLGPDNLAEQLQLLHCMWSVCESTDRPWWVDMETRVRTDDGERLDMSRVRQCLQIAAGFVTPIPC